MQTAKGSSQYKFQHYDVFITPFSQKKLQITVVDPFEKIQFQQKVLTLNNIGVATLIKALEKKLLQVKLGMKLNKTKQNAVLQIDVLVASQFLKPVEELIYLKKTRDISESQILKNAVSSISSKIKTIKQNQKTSSNIVKVGTVQDQDKLYNVGANFQPFGSINLKKGKYLLTVSFLMKATNTYMYIYFGQGQQLINSCLIYAPTNSQYIPFVIRKLHNISNNQENVTFTTYCNQSYPVSLKNVIVTAQEIV